MIKLPPTRRLCFHFVNTVTWAPAPLNWREQVPPPISNSGVTGAQHKLMGLAYL